MKGTWRLCSAGVGLSFVWLKGALMCGVFSLIGSHVEIWILYYYIVDLDEDGVIFSELMHRGWPEKRRYQFEISKLL